MNDVPPMLEFATPSQVYFGGGVGLFAEIGGADVCVVCLFFESSSNSSSRKVVIENLQLEKSKSMNHCHMMSLLLPHTKSKCIPLHRSYPQT